jgi:hypothetical protein
MVQWFTGLFSMSSAAKRGRPAAVRRVRPALECLEGRRLMDAALVSSALGADAAIPTEQFCPILTPIAESDRPIDSPVAGIEDGSDVSMPDPDGDTDDQKPPAPPSPLAGEDAADAAAAEALPPKNFAEGLFDSSAIDEVFSSLPGYGASGPGMWIAEKVGEAFIGMLWDAATSDPDHGGEGGGEGAGPEGQGGEGGAGQDYTADDNTEDDADTCDDTDDDDDFDYPVPWEILH